MKPATSVAAPPPSATTVPRRSSRSSDQRRSTTANCLAGSPAGTSCTLCRREPSPLRTTAPWMLEHVRVGDERHRLRARHELAQPLERTGLMVDACGREEHRVGVAARDDRVGDLEVQRAPLLVELAEPSARSAPAAGRCRAHAARRCRRRRRRRPRTPARRAAARTAGVVTAPPPRSSTAGSRPASANSISCASSLRNAGSPCSREERRDVADRGSRSRRRGRRRRGSGARRPTGAGSTCPHP